MNENYKLNDSDEFASLMSPEEDYQKILNTERDIGAKENTKFIVLNMYNMKMEVDVIAKAVDMDATKVQEIIDKNK